MIFDSQIPSVSAPCTTALSRRYFPEAAKFLELTLLGHLCPNNTVNIPEDRNQLQILFSAHSNPNDQKYFSKRQNRSNVTRTQLWQNATNNHGSLTTNLFTLGRGLSVCCSPFIDSNLALNDFAVSKLACSESSKLTALLFDCFSGSHFSNFSFRALAFAAFWAY